MSSILPTEPAPSAAEEPQRARRRLHVPRPRVPKPRTRQEGGACGNCGFDDTGHYCSRCGEPLHGTEESVLEILWSDLVEGPVHNLFALAKTSWLMLVHPHRFFHGVLLRQRGLASFPFFLAPAWSRVSHKPHGVPNAVKYFVLIISLAALVSWGFRVQLMPNISAVFWEGTLPGLLTDTLFLLFVVFAAWMYAAAVSKLLGGRIETAVLTKFMLYVNGFAIIPFAGMMVAGTRHLWILLICLGFWLYTLFALPQVALPRLFRVERWRLGLAQAGASVANLVIMVALVFIGGVLAASLGWLVRPGAAATGLQPDFDMRGSGMSAVERTAEATVFPMVDSAFVIPFRIEQVLPARPVPAQRSTRSTSLRRRHTR